MVSPFPWLFRMNFPSTFKKSFSVQLVDTFSLEQAVIHIKLKMNIMLFLMTHYFLMFSILPTVSMTGPNRPDSTRGDALS